MKIKLTQPAAEVIEAEAKAVLRTAIRERFNFRGKEAGAAQERRLLRVADVLGALDIPDWPVAQGGTFAFEFTDDAIEWLTTTYRENRQTLEYLDSVDEDTLAACGQMAYLVWVCDRIVRLSK